MSNEIHPTALVHPTARLGRGTTVGPWALIEEDAVIGAHCRIEAHAVIKRYTRMGDHNRVFEGAVLGGAPQHLEYRPGTVSYLHIGSHNVFREGVTVHRALLEGEATWIGDHNYLMAYSHVAHDCRLEDRIVVANNAALAGHIWVQSRAFISGGVVIHQFCRLGRLSMAGGQAKVVQDIPPFCLADGSPARLRGLNRVGLMRAGFTPQEISELKKAYRLLTRADLERKERLRLLREMPSPHATQLAEFVEGSQRGICSLRRE